jgi:hypothetical protein
MTDMDDRQALERYRYLLRTAPPEEIERAHEDGFSQLTPEQRRLALAELSRHVDPSEIRGDDPRSLARTATRAEMRQPGTLERAFGGSNVPGLGSMFFATLAGVFVGSAIADAMFDDAPVDGSAAGDADMTAADTGGDFGGGDFGRGDFGGGDFGGGDFG